MRRFPVPAKCRFVYALTTFWAGLSAAPGAPALAGGVAAGGAAAGVAPVAAAEAAGAEAEAGAEFVWPTDASRCVTSSFAEFRPGHFHAGIDISTQGRVGFRCFAVSDGEIFRARVSCGGYGRALYLRLHDGRIAVYAHLSRFAGALGDSIRARQAAAGDAYLDVEFPAGTFPVDAGDVVAWTGESGVGVPHLHFELRDPQSRPLNPLKAGFTAADTSPPAVTRVAVVPLTPASSVDGRSDVAILDVHPRAAGHGFIPRTLPVEGEIGLAIEIDETTDACRFRLAPSRMELREGDELLYAVEYDRFTFAESKDMDFQIVPQFSYEKIGRFHCVWRRAGNQLPFADAAATTDGRLKAGRGPRETRSWRRAAADAADPTSEFPRRGSVQTAPEKVRRLTLVVEDAAGNQTRTELNLSFAAPPEIAVLTADYVAPADDAGFEAAPVDTVHVFGAVRAGGRPGTRVALEWSPSGGKTWIAASSPEIDPDGSFEAKLVVRREAMGQGRPLVVVRAQAEDERGGVGIARSVGLSGAGDLPPPAPVGEVITRGGWVEVRYSDSVLWNSAVGGWEALPSPDLESELAPREAAVLVRPYGKGLRVILDARAGLERPRAWTGFGAEWTAYDAWGRIVPLSFVAAPVARPQRAQRYASAEGAVALEIPAGAVRESAIVQIRPAEAPPAVPAALRPLSAWYEVDAGTIPFAAEYDLTLRAWPNVEFDPSRVGIFVQDGDRIRYIGGEREGNGEAWAVSSRTVLPVGLFEDLDAPVLGQPRLETKYGRTRLAFTAEDEGSGISCSDLEVLFEGSPIPTELDDETGDVIASPPIAARAGEGGVFEIRAVDRCGNSSRRVEELRFP